MAKRVRGTVRPGQRRPSGRPQPRPNTLASAASTAAAATSSPAPVRSGGLTPDEERRAAELEAQIAEQERAAEESRRRRTGRDRVGTGGDGHTAQAGSLAQVASQEYAYVVRDVRRIVRIGGLLLAILLALYLVIEVGHVVRI